jgi:prepilin-type N-terminal cleavage/methylation domain-containing protein
MHSIAPKTMKLRNAFTLVELLVAIAIIGILMSIAIPAIMRSITTAKATSIRMEVSALEQAIEQYQQKYGDYPPDFSDWNVVSRHYRKLFPRMGTNDFTLLFNMVHSGSPAVFQPTSMDRAEALVWALGGYSEDIQRPFTGPGGPLSWIGDGVKSYTDSSVTDVERQTSSNFQINADRVNSLFSFDADKLCYSKINSSSPITGTNRYTSTDDGDLFLTYAARDGGAPIVYFDSRTYDVYNASFGGFNGYGSTTFGAIRPYLSDKSNANPSGTPYATLPAALNGWQFMKKESFQIISAGLDNNFGSVGVGTLSSRQVFFQYPMGTAIEPSTSATTPGGLVVANVKGFQETSAFSGVVDNFHLDNITNFSTSQLLDDVP